MKAKVTAYYKIGAQQIKATKFTGGENGIMIEQLIEKNRSYRKFHEAEAVKLATLKVGRMSGAISASMSSFCASKLTG